MVRRPRVMYGTRFSRLHLSKVLGWTWSNAAALSEESKGSKEDGKSDNGCDLEFRRLDTAPPIQGLVPNAVSSAPNSCLFSRL
jgi:hypothetical protein